MRYLKHRFCHKHFLFRALLLSILFALVFIVIYKEYHNDSFQFFSIPAQPESPYLRVLARDNQQVLNFKRFPLSLPKAWVLEATIFKGKEEADKLIQVLHTKNLSAYCRSVPSFGAPDIRIFIAPTFSMEEAQQIAHRLSSEMNLKTKVIPFDPLLAN